MCGALRYIGREDGGYIICMCVCVYVFFLLGVCDIYVFTIHVTYVFLGLSYIQKVRMIIHNSRCIIHMGLCSIQIVIHKCMG